MFPHAQCLRVTVRKLSRSLPIIMSTGLFLGTFAVMQGAEWIARAYFLAIGARWARIPGVGFLRSFWAIVAAGLVAWIPAVLLAAIPCSRLAQVLVVLALQLAS